MESPNENLFDPTEGSLVQQIKASIARMDEEEAEKDRMAAELLNGFSPKRTTVPPKSVPAPEPKKREDWGLGRSLPNGDL